MTVPLWPTQLPQCFLYEGLEAGLPDGRLRTPTDTGPGKMRRRYSGAVTPVAGQILATPGQRQRFLRFWNEELSGGTLPFVVQDQFIHGRKLTDEDGEVVTDEDGEDVLITAYWLAVFDSPPQIAKVSPAKYRIAFQLNVLP